MKEQELKSNIIQAGYKAVIELIRVAEEQIIMDDPNEDLAAEAFGIGLGLFCAAIAGEALSPGFTDKNPFVISSSFLLILSAPIWGISQIFYPEQKKNIKKPIFPNIILEQEYTNEQINSLAESFNRRLYNYIQSN